jgi:aldehyde:ferredoxin oxidoreductase
MIKGGYAGKLLFIDLTNGTIDEKPLSEEIATKFVGGYGIGARILYGIMKKGANPFGPDSFECNQRIFWRPICSGMQVSNYRRLE